MKLQGEFVVRQVLDDVVAIPVGQTALKVGGMILLNDVSRVIWNCLETGTTEEAILTAITDAFAVSDEEARADIAEFLDQLRSAQLLQE